MKTQAMRRNVPMTAEQRAAALLRPYLKRREEVILEVHNKTVDAGATDHEAVLFDAIGGYKLKVSDYTEIATTALEIKSTTGAYQAMLNYLAAGYTFMVDLIKLEVTTEAEEAQFQNTMRLLRDRFSGKKMDVVREIQPDTSRNSGQFQSKLLEIAVGRLFITPADALEFVVNANTKLFVKLNGYLIPTSVADRLGQTITK